MRDPNRIDKCVEAFANKWKKCPDMRMGQLMMNILMEYTRQHKGRDAFYVEDKEFVEFLNNLWTKQTK